MCDLEGGKGVSACKILENCQDKMIGMDEGW
jgi:hypothetical protein